MLHEIGNAKPQLSESPLPEPEVRQAFRNASLPVIVGFLIFVTGGSPDFRTLQPLGNVWVWNKDVPHNGI